MAQDLEAPVEVFDLPKPQYEPRGLPAGGFRIHPSLRIAETYDDNILADEDDVEADLVTTTAAKLEIDSQWSRHSLELDGFVEDGRYLANSDQTRQQFGLRPSFELELIEQQRLSGAAAYRREVLSRSDPDDLGDRDPTELNRFIGELDYISSYNRLSLGVLGRVDRRDFVAASEDDRDRLEWRFAPRLGYQVAPKLEVFLSPFVVGRDFDQLDDDGLDRDARLFGATTGARTELTSLVHLDVAFGAVYNDFEDPSFDDTLDLLIEAAADWYVTPTSTFKARLSRRDIATDQPGSSSRTETQAQAELQHELQHNLLLGLRLGYIYDAFRETSRDDDRASIDLEARYLINRVFSIGARYRYEQRWSSAESEDFLRNRFTLGLRAQF